MAVTCIICISDERRCLCTGQGWLQSLEIENERLHGELDALRTRAVLTPQHELRAKNERMTAQLREVEKSDKTRAQLGFEVAQLKQELDKLRRSNGKNSSTALRRQVKVTVSGKISGRCEGSCFLGFHRSCLLFQRFSRVYENLLACLSVAEPANAECCVLPHCDGV